MARVAVDDRCFKCRACIDACPVPGTITNTLPGKVRVNEDKCIGCAFCIPACPTNALTMLTPEPVIFITVPKVPEPSPLEVVTVTPQTKARKPKRGR